MGRRVKLLTNLLEKNGRNPLGCRPGKQCYSYFVKAINRKCAPS